MDIVLDKSYLQGAPRNELESIFCDHRVLMPEMLLHELLTTDPKVRAQCFSRLPKKENPLVLIPNPGPLMRWEVENNRALTNIDDVTIDIRYQFNKNLVNVDFEMGNDQEEDLCLWRKEMSSHLGVCRTDCA